MFYGGLVMKNVYIKYFVFSRLLLASSSIFSVMPQYQNKITQIQEIHGAKTYTLVLKCTQREPIAVYAPATYQESLDSSQIRIFLPNTVLAEGVEPIAGTMEVMSSGVEILLFGKLIKKSASDGLIFITIEVSQ
jgi:hypothetical protein